MRLALILPQPQECLKSSVECLPALKQVRYRVWPYVTHLINWHHKPWEPMDFHPQVVKAKMNCSGQTNYTHVLATHVEVSGLGIHGKFGKGRQQLHHGRGLRRRLCGSAWGLKRLVNTNIFPVRKEPACRWWHFLTKHQDISKLPTQRTCNLFNTGVFFICFLLV